MKFRESGPVVLLLVCMVYQFNETLSKSRRSLFDELPLSGALVQNGAKDTPKAESNAPSFGKNQVSKDNPSENIGTSLFDELPNQGAIPMEGSSEALTRNTRGSFFTFDSGGSMNFEVGPSNPEQVRGKEVVLKSLYTIGKNKQIIRRPQSHSFTPAKTVSVLNAFHPPRLNFNLWGHHLPKSGAQPQTYYQQQPKSEFPTLPRPPQKVKSGPFLQEKFNRSVSQVSANAAGPTVIVYASPDGRRDWDHLGRPTSNNDNKPPIEVRGKQINNPSAKNEIHYHYHFGNDKKNKTKNGKKHPAINKGWKSKQNEMQSNGGGEDVDSEPPPIANGGYQASNIPAFRDSDSPEDDSSSSSEESEGDFSPRQLPSKPKKLKPESRASFGPLTYDKPPPPSEPVPPPSYENYKPNSEYGPPTPPPSYGPRPSENYGPPPSQSYGPPPPSPSVGPPAPPSNDSPFVAEDKYHTTISLQTIPVTRQVTEFVQVPNIIHHISSSQQNPISSDQPFQDDPQPPPHQEYGPPPEKGKKERQHSKNTSRSRPSPAPPSQTGFHAHLSKLFSSGLVSANAVGGLLGPQRNPNHLSDPELLDLLSLSGSAGSLSQSPFAPLSHQYNGNPLLPLGVNNIFGATRTSTSLSSGIRQIFPIITGPTSAPSVSTNANTEILKEIIREQRYQNILSELRSRVREESKSADRARSDYRSLFSKGAFLLSALTLLPRVVSPFAAATAAAGGSSSLTNYMMPLIPSIKRRKRSLKLNKITEPFSGTKRFETYLSKYKLQ